MRTITAYRLEPSTCAAEVGHWPQIVDLTNKTRADVDAYDRLLGADPLPDPWPRADGFLLHARAKLTDVLSNKFVPKHVGLCVSERARSLLQGFDLHRTHEWQIRFASSSQAGYWILYVERSQDIIEFSRSAYLEVDILQQPIGPERTFTSADELTEAASLLLNTTDRDLLPRRIVLTRAPDLFRLPHDSRGLLISERLKQALEDARLTGFLVTASKVEFLAADIVSNGGK